VTVPAQDVEAEEYVLGAMLAYPNAILTVTDELDPADFYRPSNSTIYRAIVELDAKGEPADALTVIDALERAGQLENAGGRTRLHELAHLAPAFSNVAHHARLVREAADLRRVAEFGRHVQQLAHEKQGEPGELLDRVEQMAYELGDRRETVDLNHNVTHTLQALRKLREEPRTLLGVPSGFKALDELTQGFQPGQLVIVAARPSMGKSALALCLAAHNLGNGLPVALFTLEMSKAEIGQRLLSLGAYVPLQSVRTPWKLPADDWQRLEDAAARLADKPLYVREAGTLTPTEIRSQIRRLKQRVPNLGLVIVDYLQLMHTTAENRVQEVSEISRALKATARDLDVPVVALSQLCRVTYIEIPRWDDFQHTDATKRGRDPIWIKTYTRLLSDDAYLALTPVQRAVLHGLWLDYARSGRKVPENTSKLSRRLGLRVTKRTLEALEQAGFLQLCQDTVTPLSILEEKREDLKPKSEEPIAVVRPPVVEGFSNPVDELAAWRVREGKRRTG
jgi:replicative DNA helicase